MPQADFPSRSLTHSVKARSLCNTSLGSKKSAPSRPAVTQTNGMAAVSPVIRRIATPPNTVMTQMNTPATQILVGASNTFRSWPANPTNVHATANAIKNGIAVSKISTIPVPR